MRQHQGRSVQRRAAGLVGAIACATMLMASAAPAAATPIEVSGITSGCFGSACVPGWTDNDPLFGLTFTGVDPFDAWTDAAGDASGILLGTLSRGNVNVSSSLSALPFTLQVVFDLPSAVGDGLFTALIAGTAPGGGGPLSVNFDNAWHLITYGDALGGGSFEFAVSGDPSVNKNASAPIYGTIRNASYTPSLEQDETTSSVPEPASMLLFGAGMLLAARRMRRARG